LNTYFGLAIPLKISILTVLKGARPPKGGSLSVSELSEFHTCTSYLHAAEGEESVPENTQKWLRWRLYDLEEGPSQPPVDGAFGGLARFKTVKMEIFNGIASPK